MNYHKVEVASDLNALFSQTDFKKSINLIDIAIDKNTFPGYTSKR